MSAHDQLFGAYIPGHSVIHRLPVGAKYLLVLAGTIPAFFTRSWIASLVLLACSVALLMLTRLPLGRAVGLGGGIWILVVILMAWNTFVGRPLDGVMNIATIVACIYLSRLLTLTTPAPVLVDARVAAARPLDRVGFNSERFGLSVALVLRSIPYLVSLSSDVRTAARARGLERNWFANLTPVVIGAVAYAQRTGDALVARGLGEDD